jgi:hypothetical protein
MLPIIIIVATMAVAPVFSADDGGLTELPVKFAGKEIPWKNLDNASMAVTLKDIMERAARRIDEIAEKRSFYASTKKKSPKRIYWRSR